MTIGVLVMCGKSYLNRYVNSVRTKQTETRWHRVGVFNNKHNSKYIFERFKIWNHVLQTTSSYMPQINQCLLSVCPALIVTKGSTPSRPQLTHTVQLQLVITQTWMHHISVLKAPIKRENIMNVCEISWKMWTIRGHRHADTQGHIHHVTIFHSIMHLLLHVRG